MSNEHPRANRAEAEARLLEETERVVTRLEAALAAAPDDAELKQKLARIVEQARRLRERVAQAIADAHARESSAEGG